MKTVLIIGVGQFGSHIARRMEELRCEVMAVDENEKHINDILPYVTNARIGDSTNEEFLRSLGVGTMMFVSLPSAAGFSPLWKQRLCSRSWGQRKSYPVRQMMYK